MNNAKQARSASPHKIVIVGGGFGGVFTAKKLRRSCPPDTNIELINEKNYFVFQPLLPEVASGVINAQDAITPHRVLLGRDVDFRQATVKKIDFDNGVVSVLQGRKRRHVDVQWDHLVLAGGQVSSLGFLRGLEEHSLVMKNLSDAFVLRNHVIQCLEWADITIRPELKRRALTFVVAGGGFSGVETIGEMHDMISRSLRYYPRIDKDEVRCILLHGGDCILPELPRRLGEYAQRQLQKRGVKVMLNTRLKAATSFYAETADGSVIHTATLVSALGNGPTSLVNSLHGIELQKGRIPTDRMLRVKGKKNVWAVGDNAQIPLNDAEGDARAFAPPTAQFALREAALLAYNIAATIKNKQLKAFHYVPRGNMASIGAYCGVAEIYGVNLRGVLAWSIWRGFYMLMLPGFVTRLRVALNWFLDYFVPRTIVEIQQDQRPAVRHACFNAGDVLFKRGDLIDGLYVVLEGKLVTRVLDSDGKEHFVRETGPQQHIGDRIRAYDTEVKGDVVAEEDTRVMIFPWRDLVKLRQSFAVMDEYLSSGEQEKYPEHIYKK
ncbi:MAG: FAD-dependent oxidoreductase [Candidatus Porifericomitaceae bacterium WSBS_2022_MAG_OTU9]